MTSWTERMHRRAATLGTVVSSCRLPLGGGPYPRRLEKVKFGFPLEQVCKHNIPGPLLVLILKLNKEGPYRKDVFRAPGHQNNIKKLVHFLQNGRLVNLDSFSIYTIASVLKKFLRKIPDGIFGLENEQRLFEIIQLDDVEVQREMIHELILSLPVHTQHLLVLLFGTFRVIATHAERARTGMTSEALGVSAAPSFFQSCVTGLDARPDDVLRFKVAMRIMKFMIDNFGVSDLFGLENYEYYARITGRVLRVEQNWIFSFRYPPDGSVPPLRDASRSTPAQLHLGDPAAAAESERPPPLTVPENTLGAHCARLSVSMEDAAALRTGGASTFSGSRALNIPLDELRDINQQAETNRSNTRLPLVHERQTERMRTRTEWFLTPQELCATDLSVAGSAAARNSLPTPGDCERRLARRSSSGREKSDRRGTRRASSVERRLVRRSSSKEQGRAVRRSASQRDKENGAAPARAASDGAGLRRSLSEQAAGGAAYRPRF